MYSMRVYIYWIYWIIYFISSDGMVWIYRLIFPIETENSYTGIKK